MKKLTSYRKLMKEWGYKENESLGLSPSVLTAGSSKKAWWVCSGCGEKWKARIVARTFGARGKPTGCPYCSNPPLLPSKNRNLLVMYPDIASQLHPTKNPGITAEKILPFANKSLWFVCEKGHEYRMLLPARTRQGQCCPKCHKSVSRIQLRVFAEVSHFYPDASLEDRSLGFEVDVFVPSLNLAIEVDGWRWHKDKVGMDKKKNDKIIGNGCIPLRLRERPLGKIGEWDVEYDDSFSDEKTLQIIKSLFLAIGKATRKSNGYDLASSFCEEDKYRQLLAIRGKIPGDKTLEHRFPQLSKMWSEKNVITPSHVRYGEHGKFWWRCKNGHEWETGIYNMIAALKRQSPSQGCPFCSGRLVTSENSLEIKSPSLASQWNKEKNKELRPCDVSVKSNRKVWWKCDKGHEWKSVIYSRSVGVGCPICYKNGGSK